MKIGKIVSFRKDLLFNGAVQIGWFEKDKIQADKAAKHFIFHGPEYHAAAAEDFSDGVHKLLDTATFTLDILERISGNISDEPFTLAIAGYGTGKSHLGVTLASLLSNPSSDVAESVLRNITMADKAIGNRAKKILGSSKQPYLVLTINGMQDFDLTAEIVRQILQIIHHNNLDTSVLENLRPRFKIATNFTESFFEPLNSDFKKVFGPGISSDVIVTRLKHQDDDVFCKVNEIFEQKMSQPIRATGQESLHDFIRVTKETYCGEGKPFGGILIIFDEFGRYLEFSVQKPHIAGSGALQKLFESVQENSDKVFLLSFIQYELKAYISRVAPELRDDLNRYVTRFDAVKKVRLSTNLETLISNLLEKKNTDELDKHTLALAQLQTSVQVKMKKWFPEIKNYSLWLDADRFERVILKGCWPLHPISTWIFYKLSSVGKSLQQRSALSLLADIINDNNNKEISPGKTIVPVDLCNESLINEFLSSERIGQQGATAHAYASVAQKYHHELREEERSILKSVLLTTKVGIKVDNRDEYVKVLVMFSGLDASMTVDALRLLEQEFAVLAWNERLHQYEIVDDAIPRSTFIKQLSSRVAEIDSQTRADIFSQKYGNWSQNQVYITDFGPQNQIPTKEWNYKISYTNVQLLNGQIDYALRSWSDARGVDEEKGQLIYCYVGADSNLETVQELSRKAIKSSFYKNQLKWEGGAPFAIIFLNDTSGIFGEKIAQYWVLQEQLNGDEAIRFSTFILNSQESTKQEIDNLFSELERNRHIIFATDKEIKPSRISVMLTSLFDNVYPKRVLFPFDGFHTARGNAAKDSQTFIKELFFGNLDRDWIAARASQQRNRAYDVLDKAWGAIGNDGVIRLKPKQSTIKAIFEDLEKELQKTVDNHTQINLGKIIKELCAPPYGCNIASAGMLLALFAGRRKSEIDIMKNEQAVSIETWLQEAMPGNFLEISVLNITTIIKVSEDALSEWEMLLEDWESEKTFIRKVSYPTKVEALETRIPVPQQLHFRLKYLQENTDRVYEELNSYKEEMYEAKEKIENGIEKKDISLLSWGASMLLELQQQVYYDQDSWTQQQKDELEQNRDFAKGHIKLFFTEWLAKQAVYNLEHLSKFKHSRVERIAPTLNKLGLTSEREQLIKHVEKVEENIRHIAEIKQTAENIEKMLQKNIITNSTPLSSINKWIEQARGFASHAKEAHKRTDLARGELEVAIAKLKKFYEECKAQICSYQKRLSSLYNIEELNTLSEITYWQKEAASLRSIFEGQDRNTEDISLVQKQLDLIQNHFERLNDLSLSEEIFEQIFIKCSYETKAFFTDDDPPLDYDFIYNGMKEAIRTTREAKAKEWIEQNLSPIQEIKLYDSQRAMSTKNRLLNMPPVLALQKINKVKDAINACDDRIDQLEVDGMLTRFESLTDRSKEQFLSRVSHYFKKLIS